MATKDIIIVGGSLSGLMHGIMLQRQGYNVHILEQDSRDPESHMAGIGAATDVLQFLDKYDKVDQPLGIPSECLQSLDTQGKVTLLLRAKRVLTSWDALYYRLRTNFDGLETRYCSRPDGFEGMGTGQARYESGKRVTDVVVVDQKVSIRVKNSGTDEETVMTTDMLIGADGTNSIVRRVFVPDDVAMPRYSGYVAWRGVVPENDVSEQTRKIFQHNVTYFLLPKEHVIVYHIPGVNGSITEGERVLNFCWYSNRSCGSLVSLTTDRDGQRHHATVPRGKVRQELWDEQCGHGALLLPEPFKEVMSGIAQPFIQVITDYHSPRASFGEGRVLLVGDAITLLRPHIAFSTNQAAFNCHSVERLVKGEITAADWEKQVVGFGYLHWRRNIWFGEWFQSPLYTSIFAGVQYWLAVASDAIRQRRWISGT